MPLNPDAVGSTGDPIQVSWTSKDALLYAVGIGAGTDELTFTTENTSEVDQQVFPTFPVVLGWGRGSAMGNIGSFNPALLVHGQQSIMLHRPIPVEGAATLQSSVTAMYDKGKAAVVVTSTEANVSGD
ncbi:MAG: MaoC family dehydratase N-terminal domain-containing protein [Ilumatobacteraceae bacterium]